MGIDHHQLREHVIRPVMYRMGVYSEAGEELLILTAATESLGGRYLHQVGGPALGIYQMEPATHGDCYNNYLAYHHVLRDTVESMSQVSHPNEMVFNLMYATAMCRAQYLRFAEPLPVAHDLPSLAQYWKTYWNTTAGAGTVAQAIDNYRNYVQ